MDEPASTYFCNCDRTTDRGLCTLRPHYASFSPARRPPKEFTSFSSTSLHQFVELCAQLTLFDLTLIPDLPTPLHLLFPVRLLYHLTTASMVAPQSTYVSLDGLILDDKPVGRISCLGQCTLLTCCGLLRRNDPLRWRMLCKHVAAGPFPSTLSIQTRLTVSALRMSSSAFR
ncbi:hypothetical protein BV25DRAFT_962874 [Artomyces pyxidatus]|uniref:Uncharacterized protein n=1 Tax=Artomyces pyxidatus TaxID=48021 RepID=A0ACB8SX56_9AGAM|nr:hypothetical protein BV25DRAFT_962874 [Artomyces pyxidatus]